MNEHKIIGIDVGERIVRVAHVNTEREIEALGVTQLSEGTVIGGKIKDTALFANALSKTFDSAIPLPIQPSGFEVSVVCSVPESALYTYRTRIAVNTSKGNVDEYIRNELRKDIPLHIDGMYFGYHEVTEGLHRYVTFVGTEKSNVSSIVDVCTTLNLTPLFVGSGMSSLGRSLLPKESNASTTLILNIESTWSHLGVLYDDGMISTSIQVPVGVNHLIKAVAAMRGKDEAQARDAVLLQGFADGPGDTELRAALSNELENIIVEISELQKYLLEQSSPALTNIILAGEGALIPAIATYISEACTIPATIGNPFTKVTLSSPFVSELEALPYARAIGLALRGIDERLPSVNLLLPYSHEHGHSHHVNDMSLEKIVSLDSIAATASHLETELQHVGTYFYKRAKTAIPLVAKKQMHVSSILGYKKRLIIAGVCAAIAVAVFIGAVIAFV